MASAQAYNGYSNYETWNVALWIDNDEGWYLIARRCRSFQRFVKEMKELGITSTPDGVSFDCLELNTDELDSVIEEL